MKFPMMFFIKLKLKQKNCKSYGSTKDPQLTKAVLSREGSTAAIIVNISNFLPRPGQALWHTPSLSALQRQRKEGKKEGRQRKEGKEEGRQGGSEEGQLANTERLLGKYSTQYETH